MSADTRTPCDSCGALVVAVAVHTIAIGPARRGAPDRVVTWQSCSICEAADQARWQEQRADEERERLEAQERSKRAAERDAERAAKQRQVQA